MALGWTRRTPAACSRYIKAFFLEAFRQLGGRISEREAGRYEIRHVPGATPGSRPADGHRTRSPVLRTYECSTFDRHLITADDRPKAAT